MLFEVLRLNVGREVVLCDTSLENEPGLSESPLTLNSLALVIPVTLNVPLKPEFAVPTGKLELVTFETVTVDPIERLCGSSVVYEAFAPPFQTALEMKLKFLISETLDIETVVGLNCSATSVLSDPVTSFDS